MIVLPSHKLTIGELFVSMAVGLILYLLPNDIRNQTDSVYLSEVLVFFTALIVTGVFLFIIKRYEAVGAALLTNSIITVSAFVFNTVNGFISKGGRFWPNIAEYQLITMFILWTVPFLFVVILRLFARDSKDTDETRRSFCRFLSLSLRALMVIYLLVIVFVQVLPRAPSTSSTRGIYYIPFDRIRECIDHAAEWGTLYLCWNGLIQVPLTFSLLVLNPKIRWWQMLFISFAFGLTLEILQFSFNTGTVYIDDLLLYMTGGMVGFFLKRLIDYIRSFLTIGQDRTMLSLDYTPLGTIDGAEPQEEGEDNLLEAETDKLSSLPLGDDTNEEMDDTVETPVSLSHRTELSSSDGE